MSIANVLAHLKYIQVLLEIIDRSGSNLDGKFEAKVSNSSIVQ